MVAAAPIKYSFYHSDGAGRDSFIRHVSENQTPFNYVPKSPEFAGNRQPGMAAHVPGYSVDYLPKPAMPKAVMGYTGSMIGLKPQVGTVFGLDGPWASEEKRPPNSYMNSGGAAPPPAIVVSSLQTAKSAHAHRADSTAHRMPGYGGHQSGHQHVAGKSHSAISVGDAGRTDFVVIGDGAPGSTSGDQLIVSRNLLPGSKNPTNPPTRTKRGYTGHLPGRHYSTNFGKSFHQGAVELLAFNGQPPAGGIPDPGRPFIADDLEISLQRTGRPQRSLNYVSGYAGFRPRTTPLP